MRRVGILTLPLNNNYGGILQAAAFYRLLETAGHHPVLLNIKWYSPPSKARVVEILERVPGQNIGGHRGRELERQPHYLFIRRFVPRRTRNLRGPDQNAFGRDDARFAIDPTLLIDRRFYDDVVAGVPPQPAPTVLAYVLDKQLSARELANMAITALGGQHRFRRRISAEAGAAALDVPSWLRAFMDADAIITDSFHRTVFAVLFGKTFVTIPNEGRGLDRFVSLLGELGLADRLLADEDPGAAKALITTPIDYGPVRERLAKLRAQSAGFLRSALSADLEPARGAPVSA
jgi:Polysaccharide pyruvyl transferase